MIEIGEDSFKYGDPTTRISIRGLRAIKDVDPTSLSDDVTYRDIGVKFFAVGRTYEGTVSPTEEELKDILREHNVPPEDVIDVQSVLVRKERHMEE